MDIESIYNKIKKIYYAVIEFPSKITKKYINNRLSEIDVSSKLYRQPLPFVLLKIILVIILISIVYPYYKNIGALFYKIFSFFKLHEIFKFKMPGQELFFKISRYIFLAVILYHLTIYLYNKVFDTFSCLFIDEKNNKIIFIKNSILFKKVYFFSINEIKELAFLENILFKFFKLGTVKINMNNREEINIKHLYKAYELVKKVNNMNSVPSETLGN